MTHIKFHKKRPRPANTSLRSAGLVWLRATKMHTIYAHNINLMSSRNSSVGIEWGYGLESPGWIPGRDKALSLLQCPNRL
jgi:hypothetical protein